jgi:asparagine synthase (glutamine-hydrolysing)
MPCSNHDYKSVKTDGICPHALPTPMNLFILAWNLPKEQAPVVLTELHRLQREVYPLVDSETLWHHQVGDSVLVACVHSAAAAALPRCYVSNSDRHVTIYDGFPVHRTGRFEVLRADQLCAHWDELPQSLEGTFAIARMTHTPVSIEVLTDPLGTEEVFSLHQGETWLISNSVRLLERIGKVTALDPLGLSLCFTIGWVGADRTLRRDIRVLPGGHKLTWRHDASPSYTPYFRRSDLVQRPVRFTRRRVKELSDTLSRMCKTISDGIGKLTCPLTAGHDTRLLASLLLGSGIPARYFTLGSYSTIDLTIARQIADVFGLEYTVSDHPGGVIDYVINDVYQDTADHWDDLCCRLVNENDGLVSLFHVALQERLPRGYHVGRFGVCLQGGGGEIARSYYGRSIPGLFTEVQTRHTMRSWIHWFVGDHDRLIRGEAIDLSKSYLEGFLKDCLDEGFTATDFPDLLYTFERVRRWFSNMNRTGLTTTDNFSPCCTRPFIEAAFSMSARRRFAEPIHYEVIRHLVPRLLDIPCDTPWHSLPPNPICARFVRSRFVKRIRQRFFPSRVNKWLDSKIDAWALPSKGGGYITDNFYNDTMSGVLEARREQIRDLCLSQSGSLAWDLVDRSRFERLMSAGTEPKERSLHLFVLLNIATVFYYEASGTACSIK